MPGSLAWHRFSDALRDFMLMHSEFQNVEMMPRGHNAFAINKREWSSFTQGCSCAATAMHVVEAHCLEGRPDGRSTALRAISDETTMHNSQTVTFEVTPSA